MGGKVPINADITIGAMRRDGCDLDGVKDPGGVVCHMAVIRGLL